MGAGFLMASLLVGGKTMTTYPQIRPILLVGGKYIATYPHRGPLRARFGPQMRRWRAARSASATFFRESAPMAGPADKPERDRPLNRAEVAPGAYLR